MAHEKEQQQQTQHAWAPLLGAAVIADAASGLDEHAVRRLLPAGTPRLWPHEAPWRWALYAWLPAGPRHDADQGGPLPAVHPLGALRLCALPTQVGYRQEAAALAAAGVPDDADVAHVGTLGLAAADVRALMGGRRLRREMQAWPGALAGVNAWLGNVQK